LKCLKEIINHQDWIFHQVAPNALDLAGCRVRVFPEKSYSPLMEGMVVLLFICDKVPDKASDWHTFLVDRNKKVCEIERQVVELK